jgi:hypothetical protein
LVQLDDIFWLFRLRLILVDAVPLDDLPHQLVWDFRPPLLFARGLEAREHLVVAHLVDERILGGAEDFLWRQLSVS